MDLISVIVPVYKVEKYLDKCVQSIVDQTYRYLEIILVDDGSPDNCPAMCDAWAQKDKRIRVIHKENGGLSDARNVGMAAATGEYIAFVDSDDWVTSVVFEQLYSLLQKDGTDIAACGVQMIYENGASERMLTNHYKGILNREQAQIALLEETHLKQPVWYKLYRRKAIEGILFPVGKYHEDAFWSYQVIGRADNVSVMADVGYYYLQRNNSIMGAKYSLKRLDAVEAAYERQVYYAKHFPQLLDRATLNLWGMVLYHGQQAILHLNTTDQKQALMQLQRVLQQYPIRKKNIRPLKLTHKIWLIGAKISLSLTCRLRNMMKIGL